MSNHSSAILRLLLATSLVSVAALGVGLYGLLRAQTPAPAPAADELAELRKELAELRQGLERTRSQLSAPGSANAIADAERRIARLEASAGSAGPSGAAAAPTADPGPGDPGDAPPARDTVVRVRSPGGVETVSNAGPVHAALQQR